MVFQRYFQPLQLAFVAQDLPCDPADSCGGVVSRQAQQSLERQSLMVTERCNRSYLI